MNTSTEESETSLGCGNILAAHAFMNHVDVILFVILFKLQLQHVLFLSRLLYLYDPHSTFVVGKIQ